MSVMPERIRLSRRAGWRKPAGTVVVARPGRWGNPFTIESYRPEFPEADDAELRRMAVEDFERMMRGERDVPAGARAYPSRDDVVRELAGKHLACWCPLDGA